MVKNTKRLALSYKLWTSKGAKVLENSTPNCKGPKILEGYNLINTYCIVESGVLPNPWDSTMKGNGLLFHSQMVLKWLIDNEVGDGALLMLL